MRAPGRRPASPSATAATVVTDPASPTSVRASPSGTTSATGRARRRRRRTRPRPGRRVGGSSRRWRSVSRTQPTSTDARVGPVAAERRTRWTRRRCPRRGTASPCRRRAARASRRRTTAPPPRRRSPPRARRRARAPHPVDEHVAVARRRASRGRDEADALDAEVRRPPPRSARTRRRCARARRRTAGRCASTPSPSRTISIRRSTSTQRAAAASTSATSSRIELVPQSIAATRVTASIRSSPHLTDVPDRRSAQGRWSTSQPSSASSPNGLTPGPAASAWRDEHVQALHPRRACRRRTPRRSRRRRRAPRGARGSRGAPRRSRRARSRRRRAGPASRASAPRPPACRPHPARGQVR